MKVPSTNFGELLRLYRAAHRLTTREMAARMNFSAATVSRLERGGSCDLDTFLGLVQWLFAKEQA